MDQQKILITGANGLLGQWLVRAVLQENFKVIATGKGPGRFPFQFGPGGKYAELDITDGNMVDEFLKMERPDLIVHAAAITQPDACELDKVSCWNCNVTGTRFLIDASTKSGSFFVFISTDFVFSGEAGPYREEDLPDPVNYYGSSKWAAEKAVEESGLDSSIIRTCLLYGNSLNGSRPNLVTWVRDSLENKKPIRVVNDQWRTPTYVEDLVSGIILVLKKRARGIFHISGKEMLTPFDMAVKTAEHFNLDQSLIEKVDASSFSQPAKRPVKTGFIIEKAVSLLGYQPRTFGEALQRMSEEKKAYAG